MYEKIKKKDLVVFTTSYDPNTATALDDQIKKAYPDDRDAQRLLIDFPTVYIINGINKNNKYDVYVGETNDIQRRTIQHINEDPKNREDFSNILKDKDLKMYVIGQRHFNKSITLDIENRLMLYLNGVSSIDNLDNRRLNEQNEYYDVNEFEGLFDKVWQELNKKNADLFPAKKIIESSALFKASPFNKLTKEQLAAKAEIVQKINKALVKVQKNPALPTQLVLVEGQAGSGKTVLMSNIFYDLVHENQLLLQEAKEEKIKAPAKLKIDFMVSQKEQLLVYQQVAKKLGIGDKNNVLFPSTFIKKTSPENKIDIAVVDEAHLLLTQNGQSFSKKYGKSMLKAIMKRAKIVLAVYDRHQILSTSSVMTEQDIKKMEECAGDNIIILKNQMRIKASSQTINWLDKLIYDGIIGPIPKDAKYEIKVFDNPAKMQEAIAHKNKDHHNGISRMVATFDWKWRPHTSKDQPKESDKYWLVSDGNWHMPWNRELKERDNKERRSKSIKYRDESWAEKDYTINEIGSTYTVQGFDLNYAGVVLGPSVKFRNGRIIHDPSASENSKATRKRDSDKSYAQQLLENEFNVLMTRGVHGLYIYAVDPELRKALEKAAK